MAGVGQIFLSTKTSYNLQNGLGRLQENARFALDLLHQNIGRAGYATSFDGINNFDDINIKENETENAALNFTKGNRTASDVISINYTSATDCLGNATGGVATDRYYLAGSTLMCLGNGSTTPGALADGIDNMQILYGEDTDEDDVANQFVNANNVNTWERVKSVTIALLANTVDEIGIASIDKNTHVLLNTPVIGPLNDNVLRRVFTTTIIIRN